eukprot:m.219754 g.219754  ORF g.219754 m.219754 type:complete len:1281 (-) comp18698_c0_seq2:81-3923(-)
MSEPRLPAVAAAAAVPFTSHDASEQPHRPPLSAVRCPVSPTESHHRTDSAAAKLAQQASEELDHSGHRHRFRQPYTAPNDDDAAATADTPQITVSSFKSMPGEEPVQWRQGYERQVDISFQERTALDKFQAGYGSLLYHLSRTVLYFLGTVLYFVVHIYNDTVSDSNGFAERRTNRSEVERTTTVAVLQIVVCLFTLLDSFLRMFVLYPPLGRRGKLFPLDIYDVINIGLAVPSLWLVHNENIYVPSFLYVWTMRNALNHFLIVLDEWLEAQTGKTLDFKWPETFLLLFTIVCIIVTAMCGIEHLESSSPENVNLDLFDSMWLSFVTFSTVGYGDIFPETALGRLWVIGMIVVTLLVLPQQFNHLIEAAEQERKSGGTIKKVGDLVVFVSGSLETATVGDLLHELFALEPSDITVVLLCSAKIEPDMFALLRKPAWKHRVKYIRGSALRQEDLVRAGVDKAQAVFLLAERGSADAVTIDNRTVFRSWAINDFRPHLPQFVQILLPENKKHLKRQKGRTICFEELKYGLLAKSSACPGISTLVTQLIHTSDGSQAECEVRAKLSTIQSQLHTAKSIFGDIQAFKEQRAGVATQDIYNLENACQHIMQRLLVRQQALAHMCSYASYSGHEIYSALVGESPLLSRYIDCNFSVSAFDALQYRVTLIAVKLACRCESNNLNEVPVESAHVCSDDPLSGWAAGEIRLHPGAEFVFRHYDRVFYISEKNLKQLSGDVSSDDDDESLVGVAPPLLEPLSPQPDEDESEQDQEQHTGKDYKVTVLPENAIYFGSKPVICRTRRKKVDRQRDALDLGDWTLDDIQKLPKFIVADFALDSEGFVDGGAYLFVRYMRSETFLLSEDGKVVPLVLLFDSVPREKFLNFIESFPAVYFYVGSLDRLNDYTLCCVLERAYTVLVLRDLYNTNQVSAEEEYLVDAKAIMAVAATHTRIPDTQIIAELNHRRNMRFMLFEAMADGQTLQADSTPTLFMFRTAYMTGSVFASSMLDTLLLQSFKPDGQDIIYLIEQLLGVKEATRFIVDPTDGHPSPEQSLDAVLTYVTVTLELLEEMAAFCGLPGDAVEPRAGQPIPCLPYDSVAKYLVMGRDILPIGLYYYFNPLMGLTEDLDVLLATEPVKQDVDLADAHQFGVNGDVEEVVALGSRMMTLIDESGSRHWQPDSRIPGAQLAKSTRLAFAVSNPALNHPVKLGDRIFVLERPAMPHEAQRPTEAVKLTEQVAPPSQSPKESPVSSRRSSRDPSLRLRVPRKDSKPLIPIFTPGSDYDQVTSTYL